MSTATPTIDAIRFTSTAHAAPDPEDQPRSEGRVDQAPHPALDVADGCHGHGHIDRLRNSPLRLPGPCLVTMTAQQRQIFDPTACSLFGVVFVGAVLLAALGVRTVTAEYVDRDDPVHLHRHAHQTPGADGQSCGHCCVRVPRGAADAVVALKSASGSSPAAPRGDPGPSRCPPSGRLRRLRGEPDRRYRGRARRPHPTHRGSDHSTGAGHRRRRHARPLLPAGLRQYVPGTALEAAVTVTARPDYSGPAQPSWSSASMPQSLWRQPRSAYPPGRLTPWFCPESSQRTISLSPVER